MDTKYILSRIDKHQKHLGTISKKCSDATKIFKGTAPARLFKVGKYDSQVYFPKTREAIESNFPYLVTGFLNSQESFVKLYPRSASSDAVERAAMKEKFLFYRQQNISLATLLLDAAKWLLITGQAAGILYEKPYSGPDFLKTLCTFRPINPAKFSVDPDAERPEEAADCCYSSTTSIYSLRKQYESDGGSFVAENIKRLFESKLQVNELENSTGILEWWGKQVVNGALKMVRVLYSTDINAIIYFKVDPYLNDIDPFCYSRFEREPGCVDGIGLPAILEPLQKAYNEIENATIDIIVRSINPMFLVRQGALVKRNDGDGYVPYKNIDVRSGESLANVVKELYPNLAGPVSYAMSMAGRLDQEMQNRASTSSMLRGASANIGTPPTAAEVNGRLTSVTEQLNFNFRLWFEEFVKVLSEKMMMLDAVKCERGISVPDQITFPYRPNMKDGVEFLTIEKSVLLEPVDVYVTCSDPSKIYAKQLVGYLQTAVMPYVAIAQESLKERGEYFDFKELLDLVMDLAPAGGVQLVKKIPVNPIEINGGVDVNKIPPAEEIIAGVEGQSDNQVNGGDPGTGAPDIVEQPYQPGLPTG